MKWFRLEGKAKLEVADTRNVFSQIRRRAICRFTNISAEAAGRPLRSSKKWMKDKDP